MLINLDKSVVYQCSFSGNVTVLGGGYTVEYTMRESFRYEMKNV